MKSLTESLTESLNEASATKLIVKDATKLDLAKSKLNGKGIEHDTDEEVIMFNSDSDVSAAMNLLRRWKIEYTLA